MLWVDYSVKLFAFPLATVLLMLLCEGGATEQEAADANGCYRIKWCGGQVAAIDIRSQKVPEEHLVIRIIRGSKQQTIFINDKRHSVWSKDLFASGVHDAEGSVGDIRFQGGSERVENDVRDTKEWRLIKQNIVLYREIKLCDERGHVKQQTFYGPFEMLLKPPGIQSN